MWTRQPTTSSTSLPIQSCIVSILLPSMANCMIPTVSTNLALFLLKLPPASMPSSSPSSVHAIGKAGSFWFFLFFDKFIFTTHAIPRRYCYELVSRGSATMSLRSGCNAMIWRIPQCRFFYISKSSYYTMALLTFPFFTLHEMRSFFLVCLGYALHHHTKLN